MVSKQFTVTEFKQNLLYAVYVKTNYAVNVNINYKTDRINNVHYIKFLGLTLDSTLSWKPHNRPTYFQAKFSMLHNQVFEVHHSLGESKNDLLL